MGLATETSCKLEELAASSGGGKLPTVRSLAATWGVSVSTVQAAIKEGVRRGWLQTRQGSGIWPLGAMPASRVPAPKLDAHRLADRIAGEIRQGRFAFGQFLSPPKGYARLHGLHPATVRKAFSILVERGLVERAGRSWKVGAPRRRFSPRHPVVLCIGASDGEGRLRMDSDPEWDFWREIQAEVIRGGFEPRVVAWKDALPEFGDDLFGAILSNWHMFDSTPLLDALRRARLPTAVWVANYEILPGRRYADARSMWFHDLANGRGAGTTMARYVGNLGHRKVAWISPFHGSPWSQNRLAGLRDALREDVELVATVDSAWTSEWDVQKDVMHAPDVLGRLDLEGIDHGGAIDELTRPLVEAVTRDRCLEIFSPRLEEALRSGATLWIAASDLVAQWCIHWLRSRGLAVPGDIAMASFDDARAATHLDLTSLRFDVQEMARSMVRQIMSGRQEHPRLTSYAGRVVERASTSPHARR